jgi:hypothetical protein
MATQNDAKATIGSEFNDDANGAAPVMARCIDHVNLSVRNLDASVNPGVFETEGPAPQRHNARSW